MKKQIILMIAILISCNSCKQAHSNKDNNSIAKTEEVLDTLSPNNAKSNTEVKKDIEILLDSAIAVKNDTIHFTFKVINNTSKNLLFFHIKYLNIETEGNRSETNYPNCEIHIIDSDNKLPQSFIVIMGRDKEEDPDDLPYAHILLHAGESKSFFRKKHIGNYQLLGNSFELKLRYVSRYNKEFIDEFKRMQKKNPKLKGYERFEGIIESNKCPFTLH